MRKLKYLAKDSAEKASPLKYKEDIYIIGFEEGFKNAFSFVQEQLTLENNKLKEYPIMTERMAAITRMQEKLNQLFEEVVNEKKES